MIELLLRLGIAPMFTPRTATQFKELRDLGWSGTQLVAAALMQARDGVLARLNTDLIPDDPMEAEAIVAQRLDPMFPMQDWLVYSELREEEEMPPSFRVEWTAARKRLEGYFDRQFGRPITHRTGTAGGSVTRTGKLAASQRLGSSA